jgi:hypothetical protein
MIFKNSRIQAQGILKPELTGVNEGFIISKQRRSLHLQKLS